MSATQSCPGPSCPTYQSCRRPSWSNRRTVQFAQCGDSTAILYQFQVFAIYLGSLSRGLNRGLTINWTGPQVKSGRFKGLSFYYLLEAFEHRIFFFGHLVTRLLQNRLKVKFNCKIIKNFIEGKNESPRPRI